MIGTFTQRYEDTVVGKKNTNLLRVGLKDMKKPKDDKLVALASNLDSRVSAVGS
jgi:hypothetical protein